MDIDLKRARQRNRQVSSPATKSGSGLSASGRRRLRQRGRDSNTQIMHHDPPAPPPSIDLLSRHERLPPRDLRLPWHCPLSTSVWRPT